MMVGWDMQEKCQVELMDTDLLVKNVDDSARMCWVTVVGGISVFVILHRVFH